jgi:hypothetical protein
MCASFSPLEQLIIEHTINVGTTTYNKHSIMLARCYDWCLTLL